MSPEIVIAVDRQLAAFDQGVPTMTVITILDALNNAGFVIHKKTALACSNEWENG